MDSLLGELGGDGELELLDVRLAEETVVRGEGGEAADGPVVGAGGVDELADVISRDELHVQQPEENSVGLGPGGLGLAEQASQREGKGTGDEAGGVEQEEGLEGAVGADEGVEETLLVEGSAVGEGGFHGTSVRTEDAIKEDLVPVDAEARLRGLLGEVDHEPPECREIVALDGRGDHPLDVGVLELVLGDDELEPLDGGMGADERTWRRCGKNTT